MIREWAGVLERGAEMAAESSAWRSMSVLERSPPQGPRTTGFP